MKKSLNYFKKRKKISIGKIRCDISYIFIPVTCIIFIIFYSFNNIFNFFQVIEEKNKEISSIQKDIDALNQEIKQQAKQCLSYQKTIVEKEESVQKLSTELHNLSRMRDMIFELAKKKDGL